MIPRNKRKRRLLILAAIGLGALIIGGAIAALVYFLSGASKSSGNQTTGKLYKKK